MSYSQSSHRIESTSKSTEEANNILGQVEDRPSAVKISLSPLSSDILENHDDIYLNNGKNSGVQVDSGSDSDDWGES